MQKNYDATDLKIPTCLHRRMIIEGNDKTMFIPGNNNSSALLNSGDTIQPSIIE
jgi:hypothetical protein